MQKKSIVLLMTSVLLSLSILAFLPGCRKSELTKVRLNEVTHSVFYAPMYIAISQGFFVEYGLDVELVNGAGSDKVMTAVLSGSSDIGLMGPEAAIYVYNEGKEDYVRMFAQVTKRDGSFLLSKTKETNFSWDNVRGKTIIGGRKGGVPEMTLEYVLKKKNIIPGKDVNVDTSIQFALMAGAFKSGQGDYVALFEPTASLMEKENGGYIVASIGKESGEIPYTGFAAKKSFIENNKSLIQNFTNAIYKGQIWAEEHTPSEIAESIKQYFPDTDVEILTTVAKRYKEQDTWMKTPVMTKESFERLQDVIEEAGELQKRVKFEDLIDTEFASKAVRTVR